MKLTRTYKEFTTTITIYQDNQMNEYLFEDGELVYTNIFNEERTYFSDGTSVII